MVIVYYTVQVAHGYSYACSVTMNGVISDDYLSVDINGARLTKEKILENLVDKASHLEVNKTMIIKGSCVTLISNVYFSPHSNEVEI